MKHFSSDDAGVHPFRVPRNEHDYRALAAYILRTLTCQPLPILMEPLSRRAGFGSEMDLYEPVMARLRAREWRAVHKWQGRNGAAYLRTIATNIVRDANRKQTRREQRESPLPAPEEGRTELEDPSARTALQHLCSEEDVRRLEGAIAGIANPLHRTIVHRILDRASVASVSADLNVSINTIHLVMSRQRRRLRVLLSERIAT